jgi:hypothetical protein
MNAAKKARSDMDDLRSGKQFWDGASEKLGYTSEFG